MSEWTLAQTDRAEKLALLHQFSFIKRQGEQEIEFRITIKEYATPPDVGGRFFAEADKQTNQKTAPYTPTGWGSTLLRALSECIKNIQQFPYEGPEAG